MEKERRKKHFLEKKERAKRDLACFFSMYLYTHMNVHSLCTVYNIGFVTPDIHKTQRKGLVYFCFSYVAVFSYIIDTCRYVLSCYEIWIWISKCAVYLGQKNSMFCLLPLRTNSVFLVFLSLGFFPCSFFSFFSFFLFFLSWQRKCTKK